MRPGPVGLASAVGAGEPRPRNPYPMVDVTIGGRHYERVRGAGLPGAVRRASMRQALALTPEAAFVAPDIARFGGCREHCPPRSAHAGTAGPGVVAVRAAATPGAPVSGAGQATPVRRLRCSGFGQAAASSRRTCEQLAQAVRSGAWSNWSKGMKIPQHSQMP